MIKHVVCYKLKDNSPENCQKTKEMLLSMEGKVPQVRGIEVGIDFLASARSYDLILQVKLDDVAAMEAYQANPYHVETVKPHMHSVMESSIAIDYQLD